MSAFIFPAFRAREWSFVAIFSVIFVLVSVATVWAIYRKAVVSAADEKWCHAQGLSFQFQSQSPSFCFGSNGQMFLPRPDGQ